MKSATISAGLLALAAKNVAAHATFQQLWVDGVDQGSTCARLPLSNSPVTDVTSDDMACNAGTSAVTSKCAVTAGSTVTVEMHQQPNDRSCSNEAIGGAHYGPVLVYMSAVSDSASAVGSDSAWFKVFEDTWASGGASGSENPWGTKDLNTCCGKMDVLIPKDIAPGDYLLRAEAIALHAAGSSGGAQMYMTCYQITVTGSGSASPDTVSIPGAYAASDPGILINIYQSLSTYVAPGPTVYSGGSTKSAGSPCVNCESTCAVGASTAAGRAVTAIASAVKTSATSPLPEISTASSANAASSAAATTSPNTTPAAAVTSVSSSAKASNTGTSGSTCERRRRSQRRNAL
ncbi:hypothetical protein GQ53DRAFT_744672 [Thozetella sp. PMI_491]|nr:hypothetical protein GQ53DRAFT_744672 [Thozetella sp. PMI_491]